MTTQPIVTSAGLKAATLAISAGGAARRRRRRRGGLVAAGLAGLLSTTMNAVRDFGGSFCGGLSTAN